MSFPLFNELGNSRLLFNINQLASYEQARDFAQRLSTGPVGIYIPSWVGGPGGFVEPGYIDPQTGVEYRYLHYRFRNGAEGMNVGLIMAKFRSYPISPLYALRVLAEEANSMARPLWPSNALYDAIRR